jgi:hypothetical protein
VSAVELRVRVLGVEDVLFADEIDSSAVLAADGGMHGKWVPSRSSRFALNLGDTLGATTLTSRPAAAPRSNTTADGCTRRWLLETGKRRSRTHDSGIEGELRDLVRGHDASLKSDVAVRGVSSLKESLKHVIQQVGCIED